MAFDSDRQALIPGQPSVVMAKISSQDSSPLEIDLSLADIPPSWMSVPLTSVTVAPGAEQSIALPVMVPRSPEFPAGDYRATLNASLRGAASTAESAVAIWSVSPFDGLDFAVSPTKASGWTGGGFTISTRNLGNTAIRVELLGSISEPAFALEMKTPMVDLDPGESRKTKVRVRSGTRWTGSRSGALTLDARVTGAQPRSAVVTFSQRPLLPVLLPVVALLLIGGLVGGFAWSNRGGSAGGISPTAFATSTGSAIVVVAQPTATPVVATATVVLTEAPTATVPTATLPPVVVSPQATVVVPATSTPHLLFSTGRGQPPGILEIYSINPDGSGLTAITQNNQDDWEPAISQNGKQIAFVSTRDGHNQIYVMNSDGSNQTRLSNEPGSDEYPNWSPVESKITFSHTVNNRTSLFIVNADGSGITELAPTPNGSNWQQNWSPNGKQIVFVSDRAGHPNLYVVDASGANLRQLTTSVEDKSPWWSHDGQHITFMSRRDGNYEIYVMNADGSSQTRLTNSPEDDLDPVWSPDDQRIGFAANGEVFSMQADGTQVKALTKGANYDSWLRWSPDGAYLAFESKNGNDREIYIANTDGSGMKRLTDNPTFDGNFMWVPLNP